MVIETFVFVDTETTGLPNQENNTTKITELCFEAVESRHLALGGVPRVTNKLKLCFNPRKPISTKATELSGLSYDLLEHQASFDHGTVESIKAFLHLLKKPICFVAHCGNGFHFPIIKKEFDDINSRLPDDILCCDSFDIFKILHQENTNVISPGNLSFKLRDIYTRLTGKAPDNANRAEGDTMMLIECAATYHTGFIQSANANCKTF